MPEAIADFAVLAQVFITECALDILEVLELSNVEGSATPQRLRTPAIGLLAIYGSRGNAPTLKNYALPSDLEAKSLECDDHA